MRIELEKYNPSWNESFNIEKKLLQHVLAPAQPVIEHIGSTAVEHLSSVPIVDILIGLPLFDLADKVATVIEGLGYKYRPEYEEAIPKRKFFSKSASGKRTHHIHLVQLNEHFWDQHMFFRDHLRSNEKSRKVYDNLKVKLSAANPEDFHNYSLAKASFIKAIEEKYF